MQITIDPTELQPGDTVIRLDDHDLSGCHCDVRVTVERVGCAECGSPNQHIPEECPAAVWYHSGPTNGACEHALLNSVEGLYIHNFELGSVAYYRALIAAVYLMHATGSCPR